MVFHRFSLGNVIRVVLVEPISHEFVWLSFYMHKRLRNRVLSKELTKHILHMLQGEHRIPWLPHLTTFRELSRELNWRTRRQSPFFRECRDSSTTHMTKASLCHPLFLEILKHEKLDQCPRLVNYVSKKHQVAVINLIRDYFGVETKFKNAKS